MDWIEIVSLDWIGSEIEKCFASVDSVTDSNQTNTVDSRFPKPSIQDRDSSGGSNPFGPLTPPVMRTQRNARTLKNYQTVCFQTPYSMAWIPYHTTWYEISQSLSSEQEGRAQRYRKRVPKNIQDLLIHPLSLLIWYCDDGSKRGDCQAGRFATQCFDEEEQNLLKKCLLDNFGLGVDVVRSGKSRPRQGKNGNSESINSLRSNSLDCFANQYRRSIDPSFCPCSTLCTFSSSEKFSSFS